MTPVLSPGTAAPLSRSESKPGHHFPKRSSIWENDEPSTTQADQKEEICIDEMNNLTPDHNALDDQEKETKTGLSSTLISWGKYARRD